MQVFGTSINSSIRSASLGSYAIRIALRMSRYDTVEQTRPLTGLGSFPDDDTDLSPTSQKWLEYSWRKLNVRLPHSQPRKP
jgi:hypothetical protein